MGPSRVIIALTGVLLACSGCGTASWAEETEARLQCGMSVQEVQTIAAREVHDDSPRGWSTHFIRDGSTELWLGFPDGKLRWVQVLWAQKMMKMAMYQRVDLCGKG